MSHKKRIKEKLRHNVDKCFVVLMRNFVCCWMFQFARAFKGLVLNCSGSVNLELINPKLHALHTLLQKEISNPTHCKNTEMQVSLSLILKEIWGQLQSKKDEVLPDDCQ